MEKFLDNRTSSKLGFRIDAARFEIEQRGWRGVVCSRLNCFTSDITSGVEFYGPVVKPPGFLN